MEGGMHFHAWARLAGRKNGRVPCRSPDQPPAREEVSLFFPLGLWASSLAQGSFLCGDGACVTRARQSIGLGWGTGIGVVTCIDGERE